MSESNGSAPDPAIPPGVVKIPAKTKKGYVLKSVHGGFVKGTPPGPGYPKGRPHHRDFLRELILELEAEETTQGKTFLRHRWEDAFKNRQTATDMLSYLLARPKPMDHTEQPDLSLTVSGGEVTVVNGSPTLHLHTNGSHGPA